MNDGGRQQTLCGIYVIWPHEFARRQVIPDPTSFDNVAFGSTVTFSRDDGRVQTYRVVGEDEADPKAGSISFVSPVARTLIGKTIGDVVSVGGQELEVIAIS